MKKILFLFLCFYTSLTYSQTKKEVVDYVNPFIGTALKGEDLTLAGTTKLNIKSII